MGAEPSTRYLADMFPPIFLHGQLLALESEVADLKAKNADADERIERLTQILKAFNRAGFGRRSDKLGSPSIDDEQQAFVFAKIGTGIAAIRACVSDWQSQQNFLR